MHEHVTQIRGKAPNVGCGMNLTLALSNKPLYHKVTNKYGLNMTEYVIMVNMYAIMRNAIINSLHWQKKCQKSSTIEA